MTLRTVGVPPPRLLLHAAVVAASTLAAAACQHDNPSQAYPRPEGAGAVEVASDDEAHQGLAEAQQNLAAATATAEAEFASHVLPAVTPGGPTPTDLPPTMLMGVVHYVARYITDTHRIADVVAEVRVASIGEGQLHVSHDYPDGTRDGSYLGVYRPVVLDVASVLK